MAIFIISALPPARKKVAPMPDRFPRKCYPCGYWNRRTDACGLIPEHRDILCPFAGACPEGLQEGGGADGQQLHQDGMP